MGDASSCPMTRTQKQQQQDHVAEVIHPTTNFRHDDWNQLYDVKAQEYFVPINRSLSGISGQCYWPRWVILSRQLKLSAQPSWYDVMENTANNNNYDEYHASASTSLALATAGFTSPLSSPRQSPFRQQSKRRTRSTPSRRAKRNKLYTPSQDEVISVDNDDNEPEKKLITIDDDDDDDVQKLPPRRKLFGRSTQDRKVTIQWSSETTYTLHFPVSKSGLGLHFFQEGSLVLFDRLERPADFGKEPQPRKGDIVISIDGIPTEKYSYDEIEAILLAENPGTHPTFVKFQRPPLLVTMNTETNPQHDYVLDFPPRSTGMGLTLCKEGTATGFVRLLRPSDFGNNPPPQEGDIVETIDGKVVGNLDYKGIQQILAENGGKSRCLVGFRRKLNISPRGEEAPLLNGENGTKQQEIFGARFSLQNEGTTQNGCPGAQDTPVLSGNLLEFEVSLGITPRGPGIVVAQFAGQAVFEKFHDFAQTLCLNGVVPIRGDEIVAVDGTSVDGLSYQHVVDVLKHSGDRKVRQLRFRRKRIPCTI